MFSWGGAVRWLGDLAVPGGTGLLVVEISTPRRARSRLVHSTGALPDSRQGTQGQLSSKYCRGESTITW